MSDIPNTNIIPPNPNINPKNLNPFAKFCVTLGALPTSYIESLSYLELLLWLCNYLQNTVIPAINNNAEALAELQQLFVELKDYVDNYFTNLDVQQEINNKLDEMAESGELQEIITSYLQIAGVLSFDTVSDMKNATNLINGSVAQTNGFYDLNDGGEARYKIRNVTNEDTINELNLIKINNSDTLVAELIITKEINVKQYGAKGDGIADDTNSFKLAMQNEDTSVLVQNGNYLLTDTIVLPKNIEITGNNAYIINKNNKTLFYVNRRNKINNLKFDLENYSTNVFQISFATLDECINDYDNNANIKINNISFNFNNTQNQGNCFLICADSTEETNKYNGTGFWGVFLNNIFIEGMFFSAIKQYVNDAQENWITSCYYENFNISKSGIYGFLGTKDENNLIASNISDGNFIVFNNWAMQASNQKTKNMFYFTQLGKILNTIKPWDWSAYAMENQLPINVLYRSVINEQPIYIQGLIKTIFHNVQITGSSFEVNGSDYQKYILSCIGHYLNYGDANKVNYYKNKVLKLNMSQNQSIEATTRTTINFDTRKFNTAGWALSYNNGIITVNEPIKHIRVNANLALSTTPTSCNIYIIKNGNIIENQLYTRNQDCISISSIIEVEQGDTIEIAINTPTATTISVASSPNNEFSLEIIE